jgi:hypothetical protein
MIRTALLAAALLVTTAVADDKKVSPPDEKAVMEAMEKQATPGPEHKKLEPLVGEWTYTAEFWMAPGGPSMKMNGEAKRKWILDGRFIQEDVTGPAQGGMPPFQGRGLVGYDNHAKKYVGTWIDSMTTSISHMTGEMDAAGKVFTWRHEDYDPVFGKKIKMRDVIRMTGPDAQVMEFYKIAPDGKEMKSGEIKLTRKK